MRKPPSFAAFHPGYDMIVCASKGRRNLKHATHYFGWLVTALLFCLPATKAAAETIAETATKWGLIGAWSLDCALPKDRGKGTLLIYEATPDGGVSHVRDFGDAKQKTRCFRPASPRTAC